jgi:hypothetical protein
MQWPARLIPTPDSFHHSEWIKKGAALVFHEGKQSKSSLLSFDIYGINQGCGSGFI